MIYLTNISVAFGGQTVLDRLTWAVRPGVRTGLVGPNGAGKSTLLRVIAGTQPVDSGEVSFEGGTTVGYLTQDVQEMPGETTVLEAALDAFADVLEREADVRALTAELEQMNAEGVNHGGDAYMKRVEQLTRAQADLDRMEAHLIRPKTESVLSGLGFEAGDMDRPLRTFSGGWRMRVALARLLLQNPSVLLLDEPTNHLDIESIDWLEQYLKGYPGAVVLVSHDRYFLDRMVTSIAELYAGKVTEYVGNYAYYLEERKERRALQQAAYDNQQREIAQTEKFIERFRYKASKATQVQSRVKALERMERVAPPPQEEAAIHFRFPEPPRSGRTVLSLSQFSKTYPNPDDPSGSGTIEVFDQAGPLAIERGSKIALIGKNGAGKSTLARILDGKEDFDGERELGYEVRPAFFAQHQADTIPHTLTALGALREVAHGQSETALRSLLGAFLFQGDDVFKPVGVLSGGERSRLALARTLLSPANFLILDEPTNHLDMASKAVLVEALRQYAGTFVVVSHDRHFLDQVATTVWWVGHGDVRIYQGSYSDYLWQRERQAEAAGAPRDGQTSAAPTPKAEPKKSGGGKKTKEQKRREAEERNRLYRAMQKGKPAAKIEDPKLLGRLVEKLENEVMRKEEEKADLEAKLADPDFYQQGDAFQQTMRAFADVEAELKDLMKQWERAAAKLEAAEA